MSSTFPTTPRAKDALVLKLISSLGLDHKTSAWIPYTDPHCFRPEARECHINSWIYKEVNQSGDICSGWVIWQHIGSGFVEAEFHSVWQSPDGNLVDVTPRINGEVTILFIPDRERQFSLSSHDGKPAIVAYDNVRMQNGRILNSIRRSLHITTTNLIYEHGLAIRASASP